MKKLLFCLTCLSASLFSQDEPKFDLEKETIGGYYMGESRYYSEYVIEFQGHKWVPRVLQHSPDCPCLAD